MPQPSTSRDNPRQRHLAFYLPQFHPIPENDEWWGQGFTEWTNVAQARPRFPGHAQPQIPGDLGFYDLRLPDTRRDQASLATEHGIDGFVYYHYWFGGKQVLEAPFEAVLTSGEPDLPFALCWANENWTRAWDGQDREIILAQNYANEAEHAEWLVRAFRDERYIRVDGKPLFLVYRASMLPDPRATTRIWRDVARARGVGEIFLCRVESFPDERTDPQRMGFDAAVQFSPDQVVVQAMTTSLPTKLRRLARRAATGKNTLVIDYDELTSEIAAQPEPPYLRFPCVTPGWDNSPRRKDWPLVVTRSTPERYGEWVRRASAAAPSTPDGDSLLFVNAWNEWAEGAHLEPSRRWGRQYLEAHRDARASAPTQRPEEAPPR